MQEYLSEFISQAINSDKFTTLQIFACILATCEFDKDITEQIKARGNLLFKGKKFNSNHDRVCFIKSELFKTKTILQKIEATRFLELVSEIGNSVTFDVHGRKGNIS